MSQKENILKTLGFITSLSIAGVATYISIQFPLAGAAFLTGTEVTKKLAIGIAVKNLHDLTSSELQKLFLRHPNKAINQDLEKALIVAIKKVLNDIKDEFSTDYLGLEADEIAPIGIWLTNLAAQSEQEYIKSFEQSLNNKIVLNFLNTTPANSEIKIAHLLRDQIQDLPPKFIEYFEQRFINGIQIEFKQQLKQNKDAKTAMQILVYDSLQNGISNIKHGQQELKAYLKTLHNVTINNLDIYGELWLGAINETNVLIKKNHAEALTVFKDAKSEIINEINNKLSINAILPTLAIEQYNQLLKELKEKYNKKRKRTDNLIIKIENNKDEDLIEQIQENEYELLKLSYQINTKEGEKEQLIKDATRLANTFASQSHINTDRFEKAKALFEKGKFTEVKQLLLANEAVPTYQELEEKALQKRQSEAKRFLLLAQNNQLIKDNSNWYEETKLYYQEALNAYEHYDNCYKYADFLAKHNKNNEAIKLFKRTLKLTKDIEELGLTYNQLGIIYNLIDEVKALENYEKANEKFYELYKNNKIQYGPHLAMILNNKGELLSQIPEKILLALEPLNKALNIYEDLANKQEHQLYFEKVNTLNNIGNTYKAIGDLKKSKKEIEQASLEYQNADKHYKKAYEICKNELNNEIYIDIINTTLGNIAVLYSEINSTESVLEAKKIYEALIASYREQCEQNPFKYEVDLYRNVTNLSGILTLSNNIKAYDYALEAKSKLVKYDNIKAKKIIEAANVIINYWENND